MRREEPYIYVYLTKDEGFWCDLFDIDYPNYPRYRYVGSGKVFKYDIKNNRGLIYYNTIPYWIKVKEFSEYSAESFIERVKKGINYEQYK